MAAFGTPPTHVLIGRREQELLNLERRQTGEYAFTNPSSEKKMTYAGVEVLTTLDVESIIHFFIQ